MIKVEISCFVQDVTQYIKTSVPIVLHCRPGRANTKEMRKNAGLL